ncbi:MAG: MFS transporter [Candidatus Thermoplasmatota archaeon]|nr:MFS transporter [Candidatus Thermoplasmatota archaeon]
MDKKSFLKGLTRNLLIVGLVSLFTDLSSQMVFPLVPLYLISIGAGAWVVGLVEGAAETTASLLKVFSGYWSDRISKRKPFVFAGYGLSSITKPLFAFAYSWPLVLIVRVFERVGKGIRTAPRDAIIAESTKSSVRGKAYGFHRAMDGIGSVSGAALALLLLPVLGFKDLFLVAFIPGIIAVLFVLFIKEKNRPKEIKKKNKSLKVSLKDLPRNLKLFILVSTVFSFGHFGYAFLLLKAKNIGLGNDTAIFLYVIFYLVYTLCTIPAGILSDKIGRKPVLMTGYVLFAAMAIGLLFTSQIYAIFVIFVVYGIFYAMIDGSQRAFVADLAPPDLRATALGTFHTSIGLIALPGGFLAGILWDVISPEATFLFALALALGSILLLVFVKNKKPV